MPRIWHVVLVLSLFTPCAAAQTHGPGAPSNAFFALGGIATQPVPPTSGTQSVTLGNATVTLTGPWKFHTGDNMAWAQPNYDDSTWGTMDLTPPPGSYDPNLGSNGFVPGWTARGYKGYSGYAWYRLHLNIQNNQTALALKMPDNFDDAYQVYVNGQLIGQFGRFTAYGVAVYKALPRVFPLPADAGGPVTIAIRMWMSTATSLATPDAGGLHSPPVLGQATTIASLLRLDWDAIDRTFYSIFVELAILLMALMVALGLFWLDRTEPSYLWLGLVCTVILVEDAIRAGTLYTTRINETLGYLLSHVFLHSLVIGLWVIFWAYWFRLEKMVQIHRIVWGLTALLVVGTAMWPTPLYGRVVPIQDMVWLSPLTETLTLLLGIVLIWVTMRGIRKDRLEGCLALPPILLVIVSRFSEHLSVLHVRVVYFPFRISIRLVQISTILSLIIITVLLVRRYLYGQRERERWRSELEQARHIQSLLVPVKAPSTPGFAVESVYFPASEVGGDFFHLRPGEDGSLLVVVGDVSGKGLKAAMTVSTIVGALRGCTLREPAAVLEYLNRVLHGQIKGFATCCATLIAADGSMMVANAGHIPPYRNGREMGIPGDVPLGILPDVKYEEHRFKLAPNDRLTFVSDGIVEAMNTKRELFGFDRTQQISNQPAAVIAEAARQFGQEDDITVLSVVFEPAKISPAKPSLAVLAPLQTAESV